MSRSKASPRRTVTPDPKYNSIRVAKLINRTMKDGKKSQARKQIYAAFDLLETEHKRNPVEIFEDALRAVMPQMEVRSRRVGGAAYQVPTPVRGPRAFSLAVRWIIEEARKRPSSTYHTFAEKFAAEISDALKGEGGTISKKTTMHRMADANKAFAHFRW
ncbi:MAG TPA: 30S ribosomal protein S7 [Patescibacteria group bacterium]|nr:30S ribosomal protein S7 [Patescibacteria group bacterium]